MGNHSELFRRTAILAVIAATLTFGTARAWAQGHARTAQQGNRIR